MIIRVSYFCLLICVILLNACALRTVVLRTPIDLTHSFDEQTIYWPTEEGFVHQQEFYGHTDKGYFYSAYRLCAAEHGGTHIDAPIHFQESGQTLDQIPLWRLIGPGVLIDVSAESGKNRDYLISVDDLKEWEVKHAQTLEDKIVLLKTGFANYWPNRLLYMGTDEKGPEAVKKLHFPGLHPDAARWLAKNRRIRAVGIDTPSIDFGQTSSYGAHRTLFEFNVPAFENVANLDLVPVFGFDVIALPMKIKHGSGGPLRIVALVAPENGAQPPLAR